MPSLTPSLSAVPRTQVRLLVQDGGILSATTGITPDQSSIVELGSRRASRPDGGGSGRRLLSGNSTIVGDVKVSTTSRSWTPSFGPASRSLDTDIDRNYEQAPTACS